MLYDIWPRTGFTGLGPQGAYSQNLLKYFLTKDLKIVR
jgi:hypothetical protein